ncbi:MAG TPA: polyprenol monophosphomannose synthase [Bacteriovoracaceae bacterium]|nr:polyprenol monophosphomannose synthase [Bacteriovoracaceae bacterium]
MISLDNSVVIIPTYNEIANIEKMLSTLDRLHPALNVLIIDDASPDGTAAAVKSFQQKKSNLHLLQRSEKLGLGTAYIMGFRWALEKNFEAVITMDCDFSHEPEAIPGFLENLQSHDLVVGSRYTGGIRIMNWPMHRLLLSYFATIYAGTITGIPFSDSTGGFNAYSRKALSSLNLDKIFSIGYAFQIELKYKLWSLGFPCFEFPITFFERNKGKSKMSKKIIAEAVINVFRLRFKKMLGVLQ